MEQNSQKRVSPMGPGIRVNVDPVFIEGVHRAQLSANGLLEGKLFGSWRSLQGICYHDIIPNQNTLRFIYRKTNLPVDLS